MAPGNGLVVVMFRPLVVVLMVIPRPIVAVCAGTSVSVTCTTKEKLPAAVGVPEITPAVESNNPVGRLPLVKVHVYGFTPPVADSGWL